MKRTRKIIIQNKIFTLDDLKRVAAVFDRQRQLAKKSDHHATTRFVVQLSDNTSIESDSTEVLNEGVLRGPGRPVEVQFSFLNYSLERDLSFRVSHGDSSYGNMATISGTEEKWINDNYVSLKEAIETVRPQTFWFRRHQTFGLHLIALAVGSLIQFCIEIFLGWLITYWGVDSIVKPLPPDSPWRAVIPKVLPMFYVVKWLIRWLIGMMWAFEVRTWLLRLWPNIELDFGSEHLKLEKLQRKRIVAFISLIVVPIVASLIYDFLKLTF